MNTTNNPTTKVQIALFIMISLAVIFFAFSSMACDSGDGWTNDSNSQPLFDTNGGGNGGLPQLWDTHEGEDVVESIFGTPSECNGAAKNSMLCK